MQVVVRKRGIIHVGVWGTNTGMCGSRVRAKIDEVMLRVMVQD